MTHFFILPLGPGNTKPKPSKSYLQNLSLDFTTCLHSHCNFLAQVLLFFSPNWSPTFQSCLLIHSAPSNQRSFQIVNRTMSLPCLKPLSLTITLKLWSPVYKTFHELALTPSLTPPCSSHPETVSASNITDALSPLGLCTCCSFCLEYYFFLFSPHLVISTSCRSQLLNQLLQKTSPTPQAWLYMALQNIAITFFIFPMMAFNMLQNNCLSTCLSLPLNSMPHKGTVSPGLARHLAHSWYTMNDD